MLGGVLPENASQDKHVVVARRLLLKPKQRRESGEDKREFETLLTPDWLEFERRRKQ